MPSIQRPVSKASSHFGAADIVLNQMEIGDEPSAMKAEEQEYRSLFERPGRIGESVSPKSAIDYIPSCVDYNSGGIRRLF